MPSYSHILYLNFPHSRLRMHIQRQGVVSSVTPPSCQAASGFQSRCSKPGVDNVLHCHDRWDRQCSFVAMSAGQLSVHAECTRPIAWHHERGSSWTSAAEQRRAQDSRRGDKQHHILLASLPEQDGREAVAAAAMAVGNLVVPEEPGFGLECPSPAKRRHGIPGELPSAGSGTSSLCTSRLFRTSVRSSASRGVETGTVQLTTRCELYAARAQPTHHPWQPLRNVSASHVPAMMVTIVPPPARFYPSARFPRRTEAAQQPSASMRAGGR